MGLQTDRFHGFNAANDRLDVLCFGHDVCLTWRQSQPGKLT